MKTHLVIIVALLFSASTHAAGIRLSEPVQQDPHSETFGQKITDLPELLSLQQVADNPDQYLDTEIAIKTKVAKVCQKKGCFFIAQHKQATMRVTFLDYGFFVPTDIAGKEVTLVGKVVAHDVSEKEAAHLAKDLADGSTVATGKTYQIVASSVRIPKSDT